MLLHLHLLVLILMLLMLLLRSIASNKILINPLGLHVQCDSFSSAAEMGRPVNNVLPLVFLYLLRAAELVELEHVYLDLLGQALALLGQCVRYELLLEEGASQVLELGVAVGDGLLKTASAFRNGRTGGAVDFVWIVVVFVVFVVVVVVGGGGMVLVLLHGRVLLTLLLGLMGMMLPRYSKLPKRIVAVGFRILQSLWMMMMLLQLQLLLQILIVRPLQLRHLARQSMWVDVFLVKRQRRQVAKVRDFARESGARAKDTPLLLLLAGMAPRRVAGRG